jgi:hypothetical protein
MSELVLAMCGSYGAEALLPFLRSLRVTGSPAEVVLLLHGNPPGTAEALEREGAVTVPVDLPGVPDPTSYNVARYACYADLLRSRGDVERVLLTDCRDVIVQRDPFPRLPRTGVHLFLAHPDKPVGRCLWTQAWVRFRYGDAALPPIADRPVVCSGIVMGALAPVLGLIDLVRAELEPTLRSTHYMAGYDQGVVNVLCHQGRVPDLTLHPYGGTVVAHLGNAPPGSVPVDAGGRVVGASGEVVAVVHQLDRHPELGGVALRQSDPLSSRLPS